MHILQPKHTKLNEKETEDVLSSLNVSKSQLPKIMMSDPALGGDCSVGQVIKIERKDAEGEVSTYYRVVV